MLRFVSAGESHGRAIVGIIESFPAGFKISIDEINRHMKRRQKGYGRGKRMQIEPDKVRVLSGMRHGKTLGSPIACLIENRDWANWYKIMDPHRKPPKKLSDRQYRLMYDMTRPRPGHADLAGAIKFDTHDLRNVLERASARETAVRVACGSFARQLLEHFDIEIASHVVSIGKASLGAKKVSFETIKDLADESPVRCVDAKTSDKMVAQIKSAMRNRDTMGGVFEVRVRNVPVGLGSTAQWFTRLDAALAAAVMSIQSVKGVEIGGGFGAARRPGSQVHDPIYYQKNSRESRTKNYKRRSNNAGGTEGGISNGCEIVVRGACKPISTLMNPLETADIISHERTEAIVERSDICVVPAAAIVGEAMVAMTVASAFTDRFGNDSYGQMKANFEAYLNMEF